jgi:hypothetical protein
MNLLATEDIDIPVTAGNDIQNLFAQANDSITGPFEADNNMNDVELLATLGNASGTFTAGNDIFDLVVNAGTDVSSSVSAGNDIDTLTIGAGANATGDVGAGNNIDSLDIDAGTDVTSNVSAANTLSNGDILAGGNVGVEGTLVQISGDLGIDTLRIEGTGVFADISASEVVVDPGGDTILSDITGLSVIATTTVGSIADPVNVEASGSLTGSLFTGTDNVFVDIIVGDSINGLTVTSEGDVGTQEDPFVLTAPNNIDNTTVEGEKIFIDVTAYGQVNSLTLDAEGNLGDEDAAGYLAVSADMGINGLAMTGDNIYMDVFAGGTTAADCLGNEVTTGSNIVDLSMSVNTDTDECGDNYRVGNIGQKDHPVIVVASADIDTVSLMNNSMWAANIFTDITAAGTINDFVLDASANIGTADGDRAITGTWGISGLTLTADNIYTDVIADGSDLTCDIPVLADITGLVIDSNDITDECGVTTQAGDLGTASLARIISATGNVGATITTDNAFVDVTAGLDATVTATLDGDFGADTDRNEMSAGTDLALTVTGGADIFTTATAGNTITTLSLDGDNIFADATAAEGDILGLDIDATDQVGSEADPVELNAALDIRSSVVETGVIGADVFVNMTAGAFVRVGTLSATNMLGMAPGGNFIAGGTTGITIKMISSGGDMNMDLIAGVSRADETPFAMNINDANLPNINNMAGNSADIDVDGLTVGGDMNGTFAAAGDLSVTGVVIAGDLNGNDGDGGRAMLAAIASNGDLTFSGSVEGQMAAGLNAGTFIPTNLDSAVTIAGNSGPFQAGTVITVGNLTVDLDVSSLNGNPDMTLTNVLDGTVQLADDNFFGNATFSSTGTMTADVDARGPLSGLEDQFDERVIADGDITNLSMFSFGDMGSTSTGVTAADSIGINFVLANVDAITSIDDENGDPSAPGTLSPNNNWTGDMDLYITSSGNGDGGGIYGGPIAAGFDPFVMITEQVTDFEDAFGLGSILGEIRAEDGDPTNGLDQGDITLNWMAAGEDLGSSPDDLLVAQDDIMFTDGAFGIDLAAGLSMNDCFDPDGAAIAPGGEMLGNIVAGDDIGHAGGGLLTIDVQGGSYESHGNMAGTIVSGTEDQVDDLADGDCASDIMVEINVAGEVAGDILAGDPNMNWSGSTDGGATSDTGTGAGSFFGTITAGGPVANIEADTDIIFMDGGLVAGGDVADMTAGGSITGNMSGASFGTVSAGVAIGESGDQIASDGAIEGLIAPVINSDVTAKSIAAVAGPNMADAAVTGTFDLSEQGDLAFNDAAIDFVSGTAAMYIPDGDLNLIDMTYNSGFGGFDATGMSINSLTVTDDLTGAITVPQGGIGSLTFDNGMSNGTYADMGASVTALNDIGTVTIQGSLSGTATLESTIGNIGDVSVGIDLGGTIVANMGTVGDIFVGDDVTGSIISDLGLGDIEVQDSVTSTTIEVISGSMGDLVVGTSYDAIGDPTGDLSYTDADGDGIYYDVTIAASEDIGNISVSGSMDSDCDDIIISAGGSIGAISVSSNIEGDVSVSGASLGGLSVGGDIDGDTVSIAVSGAISETTQGTAGGAILVGGSISGTVDIAGGSIGAGGDALVVGINGMGSVNGSVFIAAQGADGDLGDVTVRDGVGTVTDSTVSISSADGSVGNVVAGDLGGDGAVSISASDSLGDVVALDNSALGLGTSVSLAVDSAAGTIGDIISHGDLDVNIADFDGNIGDLVSLNGDVTFSSVGRIGGDVGDIFASEDITGTLRVESGNIGLDGDDGGDTVTDGLGRERMDSAPQDGIYTQIGDMNAALLADGSIGDITAAAGDIVPEPLDGAGMVDLALNFEPAEDVDLTATYGVMAGGSIGNITAGMDIGGALNATVEVTGGDPITLYNGGFLAQTGSIGDVTSASGQVSGLFQSGTDVGNITSVSGGLGDGQFNRLGAVYGQILSQVDPGAVDIIFILDTSGSMSDDVDAAATTFDQTVTDLSATISDIAFGVATIAPGTGTYLNMIQDVTTDVSTVQAAITAAAAHSGSGSEHQLDALVEATTTFTPRSGAQLVYVLATDEPLLPISGQDSIATITSAAAAVNAQNASVVGLVGTGDVVITTSELSQLSVATFSMADLDGDGIADPLVFELGVGGAGISQAIVTGVTSAVDVVAVSGATSMDTTSDDLFVVAGNNVGNLEAGANADANVSAQRGDIGTVTAYSGDVVGSYTAAVGDLAGLTSHGGDVNADVNVGGSIGTIDGQNIATEGAMTVVAGGEDGAERAIGAIIAARDITTDLVIDATAGGIGELSAGGVLGAAGEADVASINVATSIETISGGNGVINLDINAEAIGTVNAAHLTDGIDNDSDDTIDEIDEIFYSENPEGVGVVGGIVAHTGDVSITVTTPGYIGTTVAAAGAIDVDYDAMGQIGVLVAKDGINGTFVAGQGFAQDGAGVSVFSLAGDITGSVVTGGDIGAIIGNDMLDVQFSMGAIESLAQTTTLTSASSSMTFVNAHGVDQTISISGSDVTVSAAVTTVAGRVISVDVSGSGSLQLASTDDRVDDAYADIQGAINIAAGSGIDVAAVSVDGDLGQLNSSDVGATIDDVSVAGDIGSVSGADDIDGVSAGGSISEIQSLFKDVRNIVAGDDIEAILSYGSIENVNAIGSINNMVAGSDIRIVQSGALVSAEAGRDVANVTVGGEISLISAARYVDNVAADSINEIHAGSIASDISGNDANGDCDYNIFAGLSVQNISTDLEVDGDNLLCETISDEGGLTDSTDVDNTVNVNINTGDSSNATNTVDSTP